MFSDKAVRTDAGVVTDKVEASSSILTSVAGAIVSVDFAVSSLETGGAGAGIAVFRGQASGSVFARGPTALVELFIEFAVMTVETFGTLAGILLHSGVLFHSLAHASVEAGGVLTLVGDPGLTVFPHKSDGTTASVEFLASVETCRSILTRPIVGAVVEVFVAEQASPPVHALALEGSRAGSVHAARILLAFVAVRTLPTFVAFALVGVIAVAVGLVAVGGALGFCAVGPVLVLLPSLQTDSLPISSTCVVSEVVIPGFAKKVTRLAIVVLRALDSV